jgi:signal transduction histidine kinase
MKGSDVSAHVHDPDRLAALQAVAMLDTPTEESFDRLTWLATRFVGAPVALVTLIDADRQFFKSSLGLPEPWLSRRETPLSYSICQYNRFAGEPLVIADARKDPLLKENLAVVDLNVIAYLGIPLVTPDGYVLGSFCVIDTTRPRPWSEEDVTVIKDLGAAVMTEIHLRTEIKARQKAEEALWGQHEELQEAYRNLARESAERLWALEELRQREQMLIQQSRMAAMGEMIGNIAHQWRQPLNLLALLAQELPVAHQNGEPSTEYLQTHVQKMMKAIRHMSKTIDDFRNFFMPDREKVDFNVQETIEKTLSLMELSLEGREVKVTAVTGEVPAVHGYPNEYSQVLLNIISNARDALVARKVANPEIRIEIGAEEGRSLVTITDNAGGIPEAIVGKIFDPYFTTKGPDQGTGIGLYMSKMIIEKNMGGTLSARNVPGGAQFRIVV